MKCDSLEPVLKLSETFTFAISIFQSWTEKTFFGLMSEQTRAFLRILFEHVGYLYPNLISLTLLTIGLILVILFRKRLVPLKMVPNTGVPAHYKHGIFYHM
ncbi:unnamed protein product [Enterobius vermicularis]|uniref:Uncharacterized protein n=1 Tax=Enterobius vermicularis TaxID=51028 RepID=A0A0N4V568_ENTVE|nr:unnamed protein product [Enterobius vermicularis]